MRRLGSWLNGLPPSMAQYSQKRLCSAGFALHIEFRQSHVNHKASLLPQLKTVEVRFGNEFDPSSLAADWGNHGCFLFLRWVICLSSAGSPAALRSVNENAQWEKTRRSSLTVFWSSFVALLREATTWAPAQAWREPRKCGGTQDSVSLLTPVSLPAKCVLVKARTAEKDVGRNVFCSTLRVAASTGFADERFLP